MATMAGADDEMIGHLIAHAKAQLNLNTMQQGMFDTAVAHSKAAREAGRALHEKVKATLQAELAKPEPDLAAVAAAADAAIDQARAQAQRDPRRVARALRDVHAGAEGGRAARCCRRGWRAGIVPREDARAHAQQVRQGVRLTRRNTSTVAAAPGPASRRALFWPPGRTPDR